MPSSKRKTGRHPRSKRFFALFSAACTVQFISGCGGGDPCLRHTDCGSGFVCNEGKCVVDLGDNPPVSDAAVPGDAGVSDTSGGATPDASGDGDENDSTDDATGPDALRDVNGADADGSRDALDVGATDARASVDGGDVSGDVGADADSGISRDADATTDAADAAG